MTVLHDKYLTLLLIQNRLPSSTNSTLINDRTWNIGLVTMLQSVKNTVSGPDVLLRSAVLNFSRYSHPERTGA